LEVIIDWSNNSYGDDRTSVGVGIVPNADDSGSMQEPDSLQTMPIANKGGNNDSSGKDGASKKDNHHRVQNILHEFVKTSNRQDDANTRRRRKPNIQNGDISLPENTITPPYRITVTSVPAHISATQLEVHRLYTKYQTAIHGDPDPFHGPMHTTPIAGSSMPSLNDHTREVTMEDEEDDCAILESNNYILQGSLKPSDFAAFYPHYSDAQRRRIYRNYIAFYRFLCDSPFPRVSVTSDDNVRSPPSTKHATTINGNTPTPTAPVSSKNLFQCDKDGYDTHVPCGFYHQQYRINGKHLLAVGVVDVLSNCLSSVYAFYDPDLSRTLNLGKVTALREIEWVRRASIHRPSLRFYYLGFYIHSCPKMKYKAEYGPSELLCPVGGSWVDFEVARRRMEERSPVRHCCNLSSGDNDLGGNDDNDDNKKMIPIDRPKEKGINRDIDNLPSDCIGGTINEDLANQIFLDIKQSSVRFITAMDLKVKGREIVLPFISEFIKEIGAELSRRCVIRWYR